MRSGLINAGVRRRLRLSAAFCLSLCLLCSLLTGCTLGASVDSMLKPPSLSKEQQQIYRALQDAAGTGITLQYPRSGAYLSAFTVVDLDADGEDEALVFYKKTNFTATENSLRLNVLDQVNGKWMSVCDYPADGAEIERVVIQPLGASPKNRILIGYSSVDQSDKSLSVYTYGDSGLTALFQTPYTMFDVADLDADSLQELLVLSRATDSAAASAALYRMDQEAVSDAGKLELRCGFSDYSQVLYGRLAGGSIGIYIDGQSGPTAVQTEILCTDSNSGALCYALPDSATVAATARSAGYLSMDVDGDGSVEIPVQQPFPGYDDSSSEQVRLTRWLSVSGSALTERMRSYYSLSDGCLFILPESWYGTVTAVTDALTGDIVFCRYDGAISDHMAELLRYGAVHDQEEQDDRTANGYQLLRSRGKTAYYMRAAQPESDELALPQEELLVRFFFVNAG